MTSKPLARTFCASFVFATTLASAAIVTTPSGVLNGSGSGVSDPFAFDAWMRMNVRVNSATGITNTFPRSGDGSAWMTLADGSGKAD